MSKLAVITGGTKGIGRAIIGKFAAEGFDIVTCSRTQSDLENLKLQVEKASSAKLHISVCDMSVRSQVLSFVEFVKGLKRPIDVLVNNTGYFSPGLVLEEQPGTLEKLMEANVYSTYYMSQGIAPLMKAKRTGHIFNMCSVASIKAMPNGGSYSVTKFAMLGYTKVLREELKDHGVRVTAVLPGATLTPSWDGVNLPEERFMKPEDVADSVFSAYSLSPRTVVEEIILRPQLGDI